MFRKLKSLLVVSLLAAPVARAADQQLTIAAASSLQDVLKEIDQALPATVAPGMKVAYNFAASSTLVRQIEADAPIDVLVSADEANMDQLEKAGKIDAASRAVVSANEVVLIVKAETPKGLITKPEDLTKPQVKHIALCDASVPIGHYGKQLLEKLGLYAKLKPKFVAPDNVRASLKYVETGSADAGFVYVTDVARDSKVQVVYHAGAKEGLSIKYPAAAIKASKQSEAAKRYVAFLTTPAAQAIFQKFGFATP